MTDLAATLDEAMEKADLFAVEAYKAKLQEDADGVMDSSAVLRAAIIAAMAAVCDRVDDQGVEATRAEVEAMNGAA